jgi:hypothetical protein
MTDDALDLIPVLIEMTVWGSRRHPHALISRERLDPAHRKRTERSYRERHIKERTAASGTQHPSRGSGRRRRRSVRT